MANRQPFPITYKPGEPVEIISRCLNRCANQGDLNKLAERLRQSYEVHDAFKNHHDELLEMWGKRHAELANKKNQPSQGAGARGKQPERQVDHLANHTSDDQHELFF